MHGCDDLDRLPLLLFLDLLLVLFGLVVELFYYLVVDFLLALVVEAETSTLLCILATTLAAGFFFLGLLGLQTDQLRVDPQASLLVKLFQLLFVGEAFLPGATEELSLEEISTVGVKQGCGVGVRGTLRLPINLSKGLVGSHEVLVEGVILFAHDLDLVRACEAVAKKENEALPLKRSQAHLLEVDGDLGDPITGVKVIFHASVTSSVLLVLSFDCEGLLVVFKFLQDLFLGTQLIVKRVLRRRLHPVRHAVVGHMVHLGLSIKSKRSARIVGQLARCEGESPLNQ